MIRDPNKDKLKSASVRMKQIQAGLKCKLIDCNNPLSLHQGPGGDCLCREHQLKSVPYGGLGKPDRPHTFYRGWVCVGTESFPGCGYNVQEDPRFEQIEDPFVRLRAMRTCMDGDHQVLKSMGGEDTQENISALCGTCHKIKTIMEQDYLGRKKDNMGI